MRSPRLIQIGIALVVTLLVRTGTAEAPALVPRTTLFRPAERSAPLISPDGTQLAWVDTTNGMAQIWIQSVGTNDARMLSRDPRGNARAPVWQSDAQAVLFLQDIEDLGASHLMQAHVASGNIRDLTPFVGVQGRLVGQSTRLLDEVLVALNLRDRRAADLFRLELRTGSLIPVEENTGEILAWYPDDSLSVTLARMVLPNGDMALATRPDARSIWRPLLRWGAEESLGRIVGFNEDATRVRILSSIGAPSQRLLEIPLGVGQPAILAQDPRYDVTAALTHPFSNSLEAVQFMRARADWQFASRDVARDFQVLREFSDGDIDIVSRDVEARRWTIGYTTPGAPVRYALYDRSTRRVEPLFSEVSAPPTNHLGLAQSITFKARDGLALEGYLTLPAGMEPKGLPAVVLIHGGPWSRTIWGFDPEVQWLANRGYAVIQVNYRGSTGYGKEHLNAGDREWGGKILLDLVDAKQWAVAQGYADTRRVAVMGTAFGGFAALACLARHPGEFAAGVSLSGPTDLLTVVNSAPPGAASLRAILERRVGHPQRDAALLKAQSPYSRAAFITAPLLLSSTASDPDAPLKDIDTFVASIRSEGRYVEYLHFANEASSLRDSRNRLRWYAAVETFLAKHLGGRAEPASPAEAWESLRR